VKKTTDGLIQFSWRDKTTGTVAEELILFPDDAVFRKVKESNGRVYLLEFKNSNRKLFYWMQDKSDEKDQENCQLINKYINNPNSGNTQGGGTEGKSGGSINSQQLYNILNRTRQGLNQTGSTRTGSTEPPTTNQPTNEGEQPQQHINLSHLRSLLETHSKPTGPTLIQILDPNEIQKSGVLDNVTINALKEFLPEGNESTPQSVMQNIRSPQFQQALDTFYYALRNSPDFAGVLLSLGIDPNLAGPNTTIEEFLIALQDVVNKKKKPGVANSYGYEHSKKIFNLILS